MGTHRDGDGTNPPPDGDSPPDGPLDLPGLPPEWGEIRIPDDASELADEAEQVRRELAERRRELAERRREPGAGLAGSPRGGEPSPAVPLLIMSVAVLITLVSLFAMTWSGSEGVDPSSTTPRAEAGQALPGLPLVDASGRPVSLPAHAPLAILLVEECVDCAGLVAATVTAAPAAVTVAAIGDSPPEWPAGLDSGSRPAPLLLADPDRTLRTGLDLGVATNAATVVLVDRFGQVRHTDPAVTGIAQFQAELAELSR